MIDLGSRVVWSSYWPRKSFIGTAMSIGKKTAHVRLHSGRMRFVKLDRLSTLR